MTLKICRARARGLFVFLALTHLSACADLPKSPDASIIASNTTLIDGVSVKQLVHGPGGTKNRNMIFIAADDESEAQFTQFIKAAYPSYSPVPRLEELAWWLYAPELNKLYDNVIYITYDKFTHDNFLTALKQAELMDVPYDLFLLTHGLPNNIVTSDGSTLFSWKDLDTLTGQLTSLRFVFMLGCFGSSLAKDWEMAGADNVISFPDINRNFFYMGFFLKYLGMTPDDIEIAYQRTNASIANDIRSSLLYTQIIAGMHMTVDEYLIISPNPELLF